jgi:hypothetical protein
VCHESKFCFYYHHAAYRRHCGLRRAASSTIRTFYICSGNLAAQVAQEELRQNDLVLVALVSKIDRVNSRVFLETEIGSLQAAASSEVLRDLKEGDVITIVVSEDESTQVSI